MKDEIALTLAVLGTDEFKARAKRWFPHDWQERAGRYDVITAASGHKFSWQAAQQLNDRALRKMRKGLERLGVTQAEALVALETMSKQGCYRHPNE